jgi:hypothetical protein
LISCLLFSLQNQQTASSSKNLPSEQWRLFGNQRIQISKISSMHAREPLFSNLDSKTFSRTKKFPSNLRSVAKNGIQLCLRIILLGVDDGLAVHVHDGALSGSVDHGAAHNNRSGLAICSFNGMTTQTCRTAVRVVVVQLSEDTESVSIILAVRENSRGENHIRLVAVALAQRNERLRHNLLRSLVLLVFGQL